MRYGSLICVVRKPVMSEMRVVWQQLVLQGENVEPSPLAIVEQQIGEAISGKVGTKLLIKGTGR